MPQRVKVWDLIAMLEGRLRDLQRDREDLDARERELVRDLVLAGMTWGDVGRVYGVTRQAARQRFGAEVVAWQRVHGSALPWEVQPSDPFYEGP